MLYNPIIKKLINENKKATETGYSSEKKIRSFFSQYAIDDTATNDRNKSDVVLKIPGIGRPIRIEVKTAFDTEFGQLTVGYDTTNERWVVHDSAFHKKKKKKNKNFVESFFDKYIEHYLKDLSAPRGPNKLFKRRGDREQIIIGLYKQPGYKDTLKALQQSWFGDQKEFRIQLSPVTLQSFYSTKGDDFLQIDDLGLYKLNDRFGIAVPFFDELDFTASAKFHIKNHGDSYTFNIALRADELDRDRSRISPLNLSRKEDANRFLRAL